MRVAQMSGGVIMERIARVLTVAGVIFILGTVPVFGATAPPTATASGVAVADIDSLLTAYPLGEDPWRTDVIAYDSASSIHLIQVGSLMESHRHQGHEENIWIVRGAGVLTVNGDKYRVKAGQVVHIPRNKVHAFRSLGSVAAVLVSVFSPGFDGKDQVYEAASDLGKEPRTK